MKNVEWVIGTLRNGNQEYVHYDCSRRVTWRSCVRITIRLCTMMMVLMQESMKSSLTLNHGLTGISKQLVNALSEEAVPFTMQLVIAVAETPHQLHQMRVVMVATAPAYAHLEHLHVKTWKSWVNCPDFFMVIQISFTRAVAHCHAPCHIFQ